MLTDEDIGKLITVMREVFVTKAEFQAEIKAIRQEIYAELNKIHKEIYAELDKIHNALDLLAHQVLALSQTNK